MAIPSQEEIFDKVRASLVDALGVDEDEVTPAATLRGDLDAESIDFLDIVFRLEKAFDIKIERGELVPTDVLENADYAKEGKLTPSGIAALKERMPFADLSKLESDPNIQNLGDLSVQDMVNFVEYKLKKSA
ncbi:MAG TPA: acyl carrier protein [Lacipirellula sp.]